MSETAERGRLLHAYLITPADGAGLEYARELARTAVCIAESGPKPCGVCEGCRKAIKGIHPDILWIDRPLDEKGKAKKELVVAQSRQVITDAFILPNEAPGKAYIIQNADAMNASAQNALLKILEEPPAYAHFILLASNPMALLPTIRSRLAAVTLRPGGDADADENELTEEFLAALNQGGLAMAEFCVSIEKLDKESMQSLLHGVSQALERRMRAPGADLQRMLAVASLLKRVETMRQSNVSSGHLAGLLMAELLNG